MRSLKILAKLLCATALILRSHSVKFAKSRGKFLRIIESLNLIAVIFVFSTSYSTDSIVNLT